MFLVVFWALVYKLSNDVLDTFIAMVTFEKKFWSIHLQFLVNCKHLARWELIVHCLTLIIIISLDFAALFLNVSYDGLAIITLCKVHP